MKIVVNKQYGGFALTKDQAIAIGVPEDQIFQNIYFGNVDRNDPKLIELVESKKYPDAWGSNLTVLEIPDNCFYRIEDYDGWEIITYSDSEIFWI